MKILKLILLTPSNFIVILAIGILFIIDLILNILVTPFAFLIDYIEKVIKFMLNLIHS